MAKEQGKFAGQTGRILERFASAILDNAGYRFVKPKDFLSLCEEGQPIYTKQCELGKNIYDKTRKCDLALYHPQKWPECLVIECKWQAVGGTTDEKYPFVVLSIAINKYPTIIILDGGGYSKGSEKWLRAQAGKDKLEHVCSQGEFQRLASKGYI